MIFTNMKLSDLCVEISYGYTASATENNTGCKFLRITDIQGGYVDWDKVPFCEIESKDITKYQLIEGDIVIARTGNSTGENFIFQGKNNAVFASYLIRYRVNKEIANPYYIWLNLRSSNWWGFVSGAKSGSAQAGANAKILGTFEIPIPDLQTQNKIADFFQHINNKIQLNTQINQTLEQIAQTLFKSWFVDFDPVRAKVQALSDGLSLEQAELAAMQAISGKTPEELTALSQTQPECYAELVETANAYPCEMVEVDGVEVPRGWEYKPADELFDIGIGKTPPRKETEWFSTNPDDMQWISIKDMGNSGVFITESSEFLTNQAVDKFNIRKIPENTVLLSFKLTIGRVSITTCETTTNEAIAHFKITDKSFLTTEYLYLFFQQFDFNSLGSTSSIATAVNSKTIKGIEILIPNEELIKAFQMKISNIFAQIKNLTMENKNLVETRDLLLPKLLNGEI